MSPSRPSSIPRLSIAPWLFWLPVLLLWALPSLAEPAPEGGPHPACWPSQESQALLEAFAERLPFSPECARDAACQQERIDAAERLVAEHPDALFLHRKLQDLTRYAPGLEQQPHLLADLRDRYAQRAEDRPDDAAAHYLYARLLSGKEDEEARDAALQRSLDADPLFPWTHLERVRFTLLKAQRVETAPESLRVFVEQCPGRASEVLRFQGSVLDESFWRPRIPKLREALAAEAPPDQTGAYPHLWKLEFRLTPPNRHSALREQVRRDLERLREHRQTDSMMWWQALEEGLQTVGDSEAVSRLEEEGGEVAPCQFWTVRKRTGPWSSKIYRTEVDPQDVKEVWKLTEQWLQQCPRDLTYSALRVNAAARHPELTDEALVAEIDRHLAVWEAEQDEPSFATVSAPWALAARLLLDRGLDTARTVELARKAVEAAEAPDEMTEMFANMPERFHLQRRRMRLAYLSDTWTLLARAHLANGDREGAEDAVAGAERILSQLEALEEEQADEGQLAFYPMAVASMLEALGKQSETLGQTADAFAFYRRAAALQPQNEELAGHAERLWGELGGTAWGWKALAALPVAEGLAVAEKPTGWQPRDEPFPDFELADLQGRTWTRDKLAGKTVLINVWATWCAPCRKELPLVQELGEHLAEDPGKTVVTLNADASIGLVQPFLDESGYGFPVLLANAFVQNAFKDLSLPRTWILDPSGTIRFQQSGFDPRHADTWVEDVLAHLETAGSASASP